MHIEGIRSLCLALPGVTEDIKWEDHLCFNVGGKMFLVTAPDNFPITASLKTTEELFEVLPEREGFIPAPYMARYHWIFVDDLERMTMEEWAKLINISYNLVFGKLSGKARKEIAAAHSK